MVALRSVMHEHHGMSSFGPRSRTPARQADQRAFPLTEKTAIGVCRLCGTTGPLSREHIPPKSSLGKSGYAVTVQRGDDYFEGRRGQLYQRGFHTPVLCETCNKITGSWYGTEFAKWSDWGRSLLEAMRTGSKRPVPAFTGYPLRIAKQVVTTMIAASVGDLLERRPDLKSFVLNRDEVAKSGQIRLTGYLCPSRAGRTTGVAVAMKPDSEPHVLIEFALQPFGYVLTLSGEPYDARPVDISHLTTFGYNEHRSIDLPHIPVLPTHEPFPGDYRTKDEIRRDAIENMLGEDRHPDAYNEARRIFAAGEGPAFFADHGEEW